MKETADLNCEQQSIGRCDLVFVKHGVIQALQQACQRHFASSMGARFEAPNLYEGYSTAAAAAVLKPCRNIEVNSGMQ
jgi:outer membrane cobalamin receptor